MLLPQNQQILAPTKHKQHPFYVCECWVSAPLFAYKKHWRRRYNALCHTKIFAERWKAQNSAKIAERAKTPCVHNFFCLLLLLLTFVNSITVRLVVVANILPLEMPE